MSNGKLGDYNNCTGCEACFNKCNFNAIKLEKNYEGFYYPKIDENKCANCGMCLKVCPAINNQIKNTFSVPTVFAAWNKDKYIRDTSSSGGIFSSLAINILNDGGVVYGAIFNDELIVQHCRIDTIDGLDKMKGSKYVQSIIGDIFLNVREDLNNNRSVLFTGVPCQVAGLYGYLERDYETLVTCELLCHGVPSPGVFEKHKRFIEKKYDSKINEFKFRYKTKERSQNIHIKFDNGMVYHTENPMEDYYYSGFQSGVILRESCYSCKYVGIKRYADITLGDFWGLSSDVMNKVNFGAFPSLVLLNSNKGINLWNMVNNNLVYEERNIKEAVAGNLHFRRSIPKSKYREAFFKEYQQLNYSVVAEKYLLNHKNYKDVIKKFIGPKVTKWLIKVLKR